MFQFFKNKKDENDAYYENHFSSNNSNNQYDSNPFPEDVSGVSSDSDTESDDYSPEYEIKFVKELSSGSIVFMIVNEVSDDFDFPGYVILTSTGKVTVLPSGFYIFVDEDIRYLEDKAKAFYQALIKV